ncbi:DUF5812 family protein [Halorubrum sp. SY-15]|uniref:DUF5812 family protein n=1 Tax=Halorubrum sp. SY-15 TaxID=3402277 RepID=UPI003EB81F83
MSDQKTSTFLVTHAESTSTVLKDVHDGQVHTLDATDEFAVDDAVEATIEPEPPMEVTYRVVEIDERWPLSIEHSEEPPTAHERAIAADQPTGELTREPRAGIGEIHVLSPPEDATDAAADDVVNDREATLSRAARLGVNRVEIRTEPGVLSVRYLP